MGGKERLPKTLGIKGVKTRMRLSVLKKKSMIILWVLKLLMLGRL